MKKIKKFLSSFFGIGESKQKNELEKNTLSLKNMSLTNKFKEGVVDNFFSTDSDKKYQEYLDKTKLINVNDFSDFENAEAEN